MKGSLIEMQVILKVYDNIPLQNIFPDLAFDSVIKENPLVFFLVKPVKLNHGDLLKIKKPHKMRHFKFVGLKIYADFMLAYSSVSSPQKGQCLKPKSL